jgi:hypothetical protein
MFAPANTGTRGPPLHEVSHPCRSFSPTSGRYLESDYSDLGPDWDLLPCLLDDELIWVRVDAARQDHYYKKINQEELDKLLLEWQQEKADRAKDFPFLQTSLVSEHVEPKAV